MVDGGLPRTRRCDSCDKLVTAERLLPSLEILNICLMSLMMSFVQGSELKEEDDVDKWMSQRKEAKNAKVMDWEACQWG